MFFLSLFLPILTITFVSIFARLLSQKGVAIILVTSIFVSFVCCCISFGEVFLFSSIGFYKIGIAFDVDGFSITWVIMQDALAVSLMLVVIFISLLVHIYSIEYMSGDPHLTRFLIYLSLFTSFMLILITASNLFQLFLGWEGVGLCSYLLVSFWYTRTQANVSSLKAFIVNRVGDFGFLLGLFLTSSLFLTLEFSELLCLVPNFLKFKVLIFNSSYDALTLVSLLLFCGAMSKSAQIFLHTWLPDAMEGPTPVSALIHAATMVAAGVFLLARCSPILIYSSSVLAIITIIGAFTAFFAATIGFFQNDIKKIIAYSTCSQLGYMIAAIGLSIFSVSIYHLINHAFFKALLFLGSGSIIHAINDNQDIRRFGGLITLLPLTYLVFFLASIALCGIPFFSGFYSKEVIIENSFETSSIIFSFLNFAAFFTALYSSRLIYITFLSFTNFLPQFKRVISESNAFITFPLLVLAVFSLFFGFFAFDFFSFSGFFKFQNSFSFVFDKIQVDSEYFKYYLKQLPLFFTLGGVYLGILYSSNFLDFFFFFSKFSFFQIFFSFFSKKWFFDIVFNYYLSLNTFWLSYSIFIKYLERGFFEFFLPIFITKTIFNLAILPSKLQTGLIYHYILYLIVIFIITVLLFIFPFLLATPFLIVVLTFFFSKFLVFSKFVDESESLILLSNIYFKFKTLYTIISSNKPLYPRLWYALIVVATYFFNIVAMCAHVFYYKYSYYPIDIGLAFTA